MRLAIKPGAHGGNIAELPATPWIGLEIVIAKGQTYRGAFSGASEDVSAIG